MADRPTGDPVYDKMLEEMPGFEFYTAQDQQLLLRGECPECIKQGRPIKQPMKKEDTGKVLTLNCPGCKSIWVLAWKGGDLTEMEYQ